MHSPSTRPCAVVCFPLPELSSKPVRPSGKPFLGRAILSRMDADLEFMRHAIAEARSAWAAGEGPRGAILVHEAKIIAPSGHRPTRDCDPTAPAQSRLL